MEIRNNAEALKALLGASSAASAETHPVRNAEAVATQSVLTGDEATLSRAATEVSQSAAGSDVRMEKVAAIQQALAAGSYSVSTSEVADKVIDVMLSGGYGSND